MKAPDLLDSGGSDRTRFDRDGSMGNWRRLPVVQACRCVRATPLGVPPPTLNPTVPSPAAPPTPPRLRAACSISARGAQAVGQGLRLVARQAGARGQVLGLQHIGAGDFAGLRLRVASRSGPVEFLR